MLKKQYITIILFLVFGIQISFSQSVSDIINAFEESYSFEKERSYSDAIKSLKNVYVENSYEINIRLGWLDYMAGSYTESVTYYNKSLSLMPYSEEARFGLILPKLALGKMTEVISLYKEIIENSPNNTQANYRLGLIYYEQKEFITAYDYFQKVLMYSPNDASALEGLKLIN